MLEDKKEAVGIESMQWSDAPTIRQLSNIFTDGIYLYDVVSKK
jgi:hypothetical protein